MPFTQEQYNTLLEAIASGANTVRYGDKTVTYNSLSDMIKVKQMMEAELFPTRKPVKNKLAIYDKGINDSSNESI